MFATVLLITLVLIAAFTDAKYHRIYNWNTYPGILAAGMLAVVGFLWERIDFETAVHWQPYLGWISWSDALLGFLACGGLMMVCFVLFGAGGGDVKLLAMIGSLIGVEHGLTVILWTFVLAGIVGLGVLLWKVGLSRLAQRAGQVTYSAVTLGTTLSVPADEKQVLRLPVVLAPCVPLALLATLAPWPIHL